MIFAIPEKDILTLITHQLHSFFLITEEEDLLINIKWASVIRKLEKCFSPNPNKYYHRDNEIFFNPYHSGQYTIMLYLLSRELFLGGNSLLADRVYYLNKALNGCDLFYEVELPEYFSLDHPVGSVIGRASYGNGFAFGQCCTVGNNKGIYPTLGKNVRMCANSSIIGNCHVGNNVIIAANSGIKDIDIPDNTIVFGHTPNNTFKSIIK